MSATRFLFIACVAFVISFSVAYGSDDAESSIAYNLEKHLRSFMDESVNYSKPNVSVKYESAAKFNPRGMGHLYNVTRMFMTAIQKKDPLPEDFVMVVDGKLVTPDLQTEWRILLAHYGGVAAVVACGAFLVVALPVVGLFFCCCRCSGRCGARSQPFEKRHDRCKRITLGVILAGVTIVILFGVVCAFVANAFMQEGVLDLPTEVKRNVNDTRLFLDNTKLEVDNLLIDNYNQLEKVLNEALSQSGVIVSEQLGAMSKAVSLSSLNDLVSGLNLIEADLTEIKALTRGLKANYDTLNSELTTTRDGLLANLRDCSGASACQVMMIQYNVSSLATDADFNALLDRYFPKLPDISHQLDEMDNYRDIASGVDRGQAEFLQVQTEIQRAVDGNAGEIRGALREAGEAMGRIDADMVKMLVEVRNQVTGEKVVNTIEDADDLVKRYSPIRYYVDMAMNGVLLLVLVCLTFGLFYGFCGRRPESSYGDDCCTKATGAKFLMIAVWLAFVFGAVLMALTLVFFVAGLATDRVLCEPLKNPSGNQLMGLVDRLVKPDMLQAFPKGKAPDITITQLIVSCHQNRSLYTVLDLENVFNISQVFDYEQKYKIREKLLAFKQNIEFNKPVTLLDARTREDLNKLAKSTLPSVDFPAYTEVLHNKIVTVNLQDLSRALTKLHVDLQMNRSIQRNIATYFQTQAKKLDHLHKTLVEKMKAQSTELIAQAARLQEHLTFNDTSLNEAVARLVADLAEAQTYLNANMGSGVQEIAEAFTNRFLELVNDYLRRVVNETQENVGRCGPISNMFNSTVKAACNNILYPFNGYWASFGWCLLLFVPMIYLCVQLASLYQKSDKYPGRLVESEYLYDAYADRDNIPLANVHDKKNHHRSYHETYDNSSSGGGGGGGGGGYAMDYGRGPPTAGQSQARYTDMAPKHWDYPAAIPPGGGSPRYHSPPVATEYERPPPYYYPGPGDNQR